MDSRFEIFLVITPGLEAPALAEARAAGFADARLVQGGVAFDGGWADVHRANLVLRGPTRVLARVGEFRAFHLAQLDKRARKFPWGDLVAPHVPIKVEATCKKSKIYHAGAAAQRIERAITETNGNPIADDAPLRIMLRIEDDLCTISVDTSGESLHKRGHKQAVNKAPMRETMAALMLRACGFDGQEPVLDPMCGSGTFAIEAAEIARGLYPGRSRNFAFEQLKSFDADAWAAMKTAQSPRDVSPMFYGSDRDGGAIIMCRANAERSGVTDMTRFEKCVINDLQRPEGPEGLVIVNPPYGGRIGDRKLLFALYGSFGRIMRERFQGWRVGLITNDAGLAKATELPFLPSEAPIAHGGLKIQLFRTDRL